MGCATSKQKVCRNCQVPFSPIRRSYSVHSKPADHHLVALTSSTLGSLDLDPAAAKEEFAMGMIEAKTWSNLIDEKIPKMPPKTPTETPPGEPETINAWEMMEGLEDVSPLRPRHLRSFSFQLPPKPCLAAAAADDDDDDHPTPRVKPILEDAAGENSPEVDSSDASIVSDFDPGVIAAFRKALEELPPANPFHLKAMMPDMVDRHSPSRKGSFFSTGNNKEKLIVYFTSLRGVRKTYEDCCHVRVILNGLGVRVDERDVSMHSGFKEELKELSGGGGAQLPRVFIGRECVGGAEEIRRMNEEGTLKKLVEVCEDVEGDFGKNGKVCDACGDIRFVPCETCSGSCKIYYDGDYEEEEEEEVDESECEFGFHRCPDCNENGLVRCPICCD